MDAATQVVLVPQIAQESFAREVVEIVRNLSKRVSDVLCCAVWYCAMLCCDVMCCDVM